VSWLFPGQEVRIDATCIDCLEPMSLNMRDGNILETEPATLVALLPLTKPDRDGSNWPDI
jgi:hypothetical protein